MNLEPTVIIVGAGPAGLGCAVALQRCGVPGVIVLDRRGPGPALKPGHGR